MGVISIHGLDEEQDKQLRNIAKSKKQHINKTVKETIGAAPDQPQMKNNRERFFRFCGCWTSKKLVEFTHAVQDFEKTDTEDWN